MKLNRWLDKFLVNKAEFAKKLGVSRQALSYWCNDSRIPKPKTIERIAKLTKGAVTRLDFPKKSGWNK